MTDLDKELDAHTKPTGQHAPPASETDPVKGKKCRLRNVAIAVGFSLLVAIGLTTGMASKAVAPPAAIAHLPFKAKATAHFDAPVPGLVGWTVKAQAGDNVVYATPDGKYTFVGVILGEKGENLTQKDISAHLTAQPTDGGEQGAAGDQAAVASQLTLLRQAAVPGLTLPGKTPGDIWVAVDPACPYCHRLVTEMADLLTKGMPHVTVHYVPVCILGMASCDAVARLKAQDEKDQSSLMTRWMQGSLGSDARTAFPVTDEVAVQQATAAEAQIGQALQQVGFTGVPDIYWMDGGKVMHRQGLPDRDTIKQILSGQGG